MFHHFLDRASVAASEVGRRVQQNARPRRCPLQRCQWSETDTKTRPPLFAYTSHSVGSQGPEERPGQEVDSVRVVRAIPMHRLTRWSKGRAVPRSGDRVHTLMLCSDARTARLFVSPSSPPVWRLPLTFTLSVDALNVQLLGIFVSQPQALMQLTGHFIHNVIPAGC